MTTTTDQRTERITALRHSAYRIRRNALEMGEVQGQGYIGQALGIADVLAVAYMDQLRHRPDDPQWPGRDRPCSRSGTTPSPRTRRSPRLGSSRSPN